MIFGFQHHFTLSVTFFALKKYGVPHCLQNQSLFIRLCIYIVLSNYCSKSQQGGLHGEISRSSNHFERESLQNGRRGTACLFLPCFLTLVSGYVTIWNLQTEALYHWFSYSYTGSSHKWSLYLQTIVYLLVIKFHCVEFTSWENIWSLSWNCEYHPKVQFRPKLRNVLFYRNVSTATVILQKVQVFITIICYAFKMFLVYFIKSGPV